MPGQKLLEKSGTGRLRMRCLWHYFHTPPMDLSTPTATTPTRPRIIQPINTHHTPKYPPTPPPSTHPHPPFSAASMESRSTASDAVRRCCPPPSPSRLALVLIEMERSRWEKWRLPFSCRLSSLRLAAAAGAKAAKGKWHSLLNSRQGAGALKDYDSAYTLAARAHLVRGTLLDRLHCAMPPADVGMQRTGSLQVCLGSPSGDVWLARMLSASVRSADTSSRRLAFESSSREISGPGRRVSRDRVW